MTDRKSDAQFAVRAATYAGSGPESLIKALKPATKKVKKFTIVYGDGDRLVSNLQFALDSVRDAHGYLIGSRSGHSSPVEKCAGCRYKEAAHVLKELIGLRKYGRLTVLNTSEGEGYIDLVRSLNL